jgi:transposase-like protein
MARSSHSLYPTDRKHDTLIPLIKQHTKKGSLYYADDHTAAYATLNLIGKTSDNTSSWKGRKNMLEMMQLISMVSKDSGAMPTHGYITTEVYRNHTYFELYLKEIEFRFNYRNENIFRILTKMMVGSVPNS